MTDYRSYQPNLERAHALLRAANTLRDHGIHLEAQAGSDDCEAARTAQALFARAISTFHYAGFEVFRTIIADRLVPAPSTKAGELAWLSVHRGITHKALQAAVSELSRLDGLADGSGLAAALACLNDLRTARESADYDPHWHATAVEAERARRNFLFVLGLGQNLASEHDSVSLLAVAALLKFRR